MHISGLGSSLAHHSVIRWLLSQSAASHYLLQTPLIFVTLKSQGPHNLCTACFISAEFSLSLQADHHDTLGVVYVAIYTNTFKHISEN